MPKIYLDSVTLWKSETYESEAHCGINIMDNILLLLPSLLANPQDFRGNICVVSIFLAEAFELQAAEVT